MDVHCVGFIGAQSSATADWQVAVCTVEKAAALVTRLTQEDALDEIGSWGRRGNAAGVVVVDELHLVEDPSRGPTLESLVARLLFASEARIIAMTANLDVREK